LVSGIAGYNAHDILVLADDTILVTYHTSSPDDVFVKRYNASGTTLNTYSFPTAIMDPTGPPRLAYALEADHFWIWIHNQTDDLYGISHFKKVRVSDGVIVVDRRQANFETGLYDGDETTDPVARFGISTSCPFFLTRDVPIAVTDESLPCCESAPAPGAAKGCPCPPAVSASNPTGNTSPSAKPIETSTGGILPPVSAGAWTPLCAGGGTVPTAADATDAESWVS
jgi:hypothetical protein